MAVKLGTARRFGVIAVPDRDIFETDGQVQVAQGLLHAFLTDNVVAGHVYVTGVNAGGHWDDAMQPVYEFGDLFEVAAQRELRSSGALDEHGQAALGPIV